MRTALLLSFVLGCGGAGDPWPERPAYLGDQRVEERFSGPHRPPPRGVRAAPGAQRVLALQAGGEDERARAVAVAFARALLDADEPALRRLLPPRVVLSLDERNAPRDEVIERCLKETRSIVYGQGRDVDAILDLPETMVRRAEQAHTPALMPSGIAKGDFIVTLVPRVASGEASRTLPCLSSLYVRAGANYPLVGLSR